MTHAHDALLSRRLFPETNPEALAAAQVQEFVTIRILERGDSPDLAALFAKRSEEDVRAAFLDRSRQLSRRDRAFWSFVLGIDRSPDAAPTDAIWPL